MGKFRTLITSLGKRWFQRGKKDTDEDDGDTPADNTPNNESPSADDSTPLRDEEGELAPLTRQGHGRVSVEEWFSDSEPSRSSLRLNESPSQSSQGLPIVYEDPAEEEPSRDRVEPTPLHVDGLADKSGSVILRPKQGHLEDLQIIHRLLLNGMNTYRPGSDNLPLRQNNLLNHILRNAINCTILSELASRQLPNNASWERNTMSSSRFRNPWRDVAASPLTSATRVIEQLNQGTTYACWFLIPALLRGFGLWPAAFR
ncbi:hypothetical protein NCS56_00447400 [Fusarium sp. Ph1]|nr:hypothetical protein NCS56_00447400 [Fusarium sp. Ph1]